MIKTLAVMLSASLAACAGQAEVRFSGEATTPELVAMDTDPDVMVVANADEPIFYTDNSYWLFRDRHWYRSNQPRSGWARVEQPPERVRRIDRPAAYVHFHHNPNTPRTTYNERRPPTPPRRSEDRPPAAPPRLPAHPPDRPDRRDQPLPGPTHEPNSQGPRPPYPNPLPPNQVPPVAPGQHDRDDPRDWRD